MNHPIIITSNNKFINLTKTNGTFIGSFPVRMDIEILPADAKQLALGWRAISFKEAKRFLKKKFKL